VTPVPDCAERLLSAGFASSHWQRLSTWAEAMSDELLSAEQAALARPELHRLLALPWSTRKLLRELPSNDNSPRVIRFDFHWTTEGWQISEANTDVPGGYAEGSDFPRLIGEYFSHCDLPGDPATAWCNAIAHVCESSRNIALLCAPGFMEDFQVVSFLAARLRDMRFQTAIASPTNLVWQDHQAYLPAAFGDEPLGCIVRFVQTEWLAKMCRSTQREFFQSRTPIANGMASAISESKRFPLLCRQMRLAMPVFRALLPATVDARKIPKSSTDWIFKTAYCNTGDTVCSADLLPARQWAKTRRQIRFFPSEWIAQKRFKTVPIDSPLGPIKPCIGVYTVNGKAAGIYGRISPRQVIDYRAMDIAVLIDS